MKELITNIVQEREKRNIVVHKKQTHQFIDLLFEVLFENTDTSLKQVSSQIRALERVLFSILSNVFEDTATAKKKATMFFKQVLKQYKILLNDAAFILNNDPASKTIEEVCISYPGFFTISVYRFAHQLLELDVPLIPRVFTEYAHSKTGIDIHPGAVIGTPFFIDHGTGIVIGETTEIGNNVKLYQGVTLGALSVSKEGATKKRHPTIKNNVVIYAGATILGGKTVVGENSTVGGNVWLINSIEANTQVFHKSQIIVKGKQIKEEPINFVI